VAEQLDREVGDALIEVRVAQQGEDQLWYVGHRHLSAARRGLRRLMVLASAASATSSGFSGAMRGASPTTWAWRASIPVAVDLVMTCPPVLAHRRSSSC
jgi:hypothetical protein